MYKSQYNIAHKPTFEREWLWKKTYSQSYLCAKLIFWKIITVFVDYD